MMSDTNRTMYLLSIIAEGFAFLPTSLVERNQYPLYAVNDSPSMSRDVYICYHISKEKQLEWTTICELIRNQIAPQN
jgi:hypothetical protein